VKYQQQQPVLAKSEKTILKQFITSLELFFPLTKIDFRGVLSPEGAAVKDKF